MSLDLTEEQEEFAESVRAFAQARLGADALRRAHEPGYAWDAAKLLADQGLLGLTIPEEDGGQGATLMEAVIARSPSTPRASSSSATCQTCSPASRCSPWR
jgi:alkylation response protein AidB-like acyl-CoA dehydrogenase